MPPGIRTERRVVRPQPEQLDVRVARLAAAQWGVVSIHELRACGLSDDGVWSRVRAGHLHPLHRGVYAVGHPNPPLRGRFLAAVKACGPTAVLSHFSAAALHGILPWDGRHPEITAPKLKLHPGIKAHRASLDARDITRRHVIPTTTPARTLFDLSYKLKFDLLRRTTRQAHSNGLVNMRQLLDTLTRAPRASKLSRVIASGLPPTRSELEDAVLDLIRSGGLEPPRVNVPMIVAGRRVIPDFRWPAQRLVVEADGAAWHDHRLAREDDAIRQALLEAHGERVVRVTWDQVISHRRQTLARFTSAGAPRIQGS
jgi:very-short-patch-repair endonuclease